MAATQEDARRLADDLGIFRPHLMGRNPSSRGILLSSLIIDESVFPLSEKAAEEVLPSLFAADSNIYVFYKPYNVVKR